MNPDDFPLFPSPFFAGLVTHRFFSTWDFYTERLGFRTVAESGAGVRLLHPCGAQLGLMPAETGETPAELVSGTNGRGFWLTLEVADAAAERMRLAVEGVPAQILPETTCWPRGAFAVSDPNGVLVVIVQRASLVKRVAAVAAPVTATA
ncbi:MAG: VOC family protein [Opitutaceae bacterium]|nr:VOC family protein [Opitutaceae bacterium]MBP9913228.1 VOC family protein [Opitutaceae bacterium]